MLDLIKKSMTTGVGLALKAVDEIEEIVQDLEKKGKMSEIDGKKFLHDLRQKYDEAYSKMEEKVESTGKEFFKKANVVTLDDLGGLKKEIRELKKANITAAEELAELKKEIRGLREALSQ